MTKEDLGKADKNIWHTLESEYILTCKRFLVEPKDFVNTKGEISEVHYVTLIKNYKILQAHYKSIEDTKRITPQYEDPLHTLKEYCSSHTVAK